MKIIACWMTVLAVGICACSGQKDAERDPSEPRAAAPASTPSTSLLAERPPIDLGDVDSGIFIEGRLAPDSATTMADAEYVETMRGRLSMTVITVRPPFPDKFLVQFDVVPVRDFIERPVVMRARAFRNETEPLGGEHAYLVGKTARQPLVDASGAVIPRAFKVDVLEGLDEVPDTLLIHVRADAWLMEAGTTEELLDPLTATSPERVALMSNPVRINFVKGEAQE